MEDSVEFLEDPLDPELGSLRIGGGCAFVVDLLFSFGTELSLTATVKGLVGVGVTELPSCSSPLSRCSASVEVSGGVEGALGGGGPESAS